MIDASLKATIRNLTYGSLPSAGRSETAIDESVTELAGITPQGEGPLLVAQVNHLKKARELLLQAQVELAMAAEEKVRNKLPKLVKDLQATIVVINK